MPRQPNDRQQYLDVLHAIAREYTDDCVLCQWSRRQQGLPLTIAEHEAARV